MNQFLFSTTIALLAVDAIAQTGIVPAGLTGPGNQSQTSNWRGGRRHQLVLHPQAVPPRTAPITALVLHADDGSAPGGLAPTFDISVLVSSQGVPLPDEASTASYAANLGSDATLVVNAARVTVPVTPRATVVLPFAQPFAWQNGDPLLIQIDFAPVPTPGIDNPAWLLDAHQLPTAFWGTIGTTTGAACPAAGQWTVTPASFDDTLAFRWGSASMPGNLPAFLLLGTSTRSFGGVPLPIDLTPIGAAGCALRTSVEATYPARTALGGGFGWALASVPLPRDPRFLGSTMHAQAMVLDATANAAGLRFSELRSETLATAPAAILASHARGPFVPGLAIDTPEIVVRNTTLVLGLQ